MLTGSKRRKKVLQQAVAIYLLLLAASFGRACSCGPRQTPLEALAQSDAVFSGEVIDIVPETYEMADVGPVEGFKVRVKVSQSWKGGPSGMAEVHTGTGYGDCGIQFSEETYLFYASKLKDGRLYTGACTRTAPLKSTGEETLELSGKLPKLSIPAGEPSLKLEGRIKEAGYNGYVFTLENRLHQRIFYVDGQCIGSWLQVWHHEKWIDYLPNYFALPPGVSPATRAKEFVNWRLGYDHLEDRRSTVFLNRRCGSTIFVGDLVRGMTWRVGFQYVTEQERAAGRRVQDSKHVVWSAAIHSTKKLPLLSFKEFSERSGFIPYPLGTEVSGDVVLPALDPAESSVQPANKVP